MRILDTAINIKNLPLQNRLVMPPMETRKADDNGQLTEALLNYYREKSAGGYIGLIIGEHCFVSQEGKACKGQLSIARDEDVPGLRQIVDCVHGNGCRIIAQISHAGGKAQTAVTGRPVIGASPVEVPHIGPKNPDIPREMSREEIGGIVKAFAAAAGRAKAAGFDGVEIHSAHGYMLNQFYTPLINRRKDEYTGDSLEGRTRLHLEVIAAVREAVGEDYPLALRLGACDYMEGGSSIEDSVKAAKAFEAAGIDLLDISGGLCRYLNPNDNGQGYFAELSQAVKEAVSIPVILTGGVVEADYAEKLLREGKADLIGVGRAILQDSSWAERAMKK